MDPSVVTHTYSHEGRMTINWIKGTSLMTRTTSTK